MSAPFGRPIIGNRWDAAADAAEPRSVSVIIAHFDQQRELDRTLAALRRQTHPRALLQIIVADDGSPTPPVVPADVTLARHEDRGFRLAAVRNLGVRHSTGDILCFLDADTAPEPDYVARITRLPSLAPDVVAVGRRRHAALADDDRPIELAGPANEIAEPAWLDDAYRRSRDLLDADARSYRFIIGAVVACSRWLFDHVGGFDESFEAYGGEDWEWAYRAWLQGAAFAHVPDAVAWHDGPDWAGRDEADRRARKNEETLRLMRSIRAPGAAPFALLGPNADVLVMLRAAESVAAGVVCVDSLLQALPDARVVVPPAVRTALEADPRVVDDWQGRTRVEVEVPAPVHVDSDAALRLRAAVAAVGDGDLGAIAFGSHAIVRASRARARDARWGAPTGWRTETRSAASITPLHDAPDLEAYFGGWWPPG
ncbi:glycosyltransferase family 2 protein [Agrococcus sp. Ld7]|uniref:glycosyltransferase family 2 protein n=1 Tax=Agrococcus sp. Ld7 TaxID=649148 RepID=UPI003865CDB7